MSSLLIHNIEENIEEGELTLIFECLDQKVNNINKIDVSDIQLSRDFKSAIINFMDKRSAEEILRSEIEIKIANWDISLMLHKKMFIVNQKYQNAGNFPLVSEQSDFQRKNTIHDSINIHSTDMGSSKLLIHNIDDTTDKEDLILIFESLHKNDKNINKIDVLDIKLSKLYKSGIIIFKDEKTANEILKSYVQQMIGNDFFCLMPSNKLFISSFKIHNICRKQNDNTITDSSYYQDFTESSCSDLNDKSNVEMRDTAQSDDYIRNLIDNPNNHYAPKHKHYNGINISNSNNLNNSPTILSKNQFNSNTSCEDYKSANQSKLSYAQMVKSNASFYSNENVVLYASSNNNKIKHTIDCNSDQPNLDSAIGNYNSNTKPMDLIDDDQWEPINFQNHSHFLNNIDDKPILYEHSVRINLSDAQFKIKEQQILIDRMISTHTIKTGFGLSRNDRKSLTLSSNNNTELKIYANELEEMLNTHSSDSELHVSSVIGNQLKTNYGIKWANSVLSYNKIIAIFKPSSLSVVGFSLDETDKGAISIKNHLVVYLVEKSFIDPKYYPNVEFLVVKNKTFLIGLPRDIIKAVRIIGD